MFGDSKFELYQVNGFRYLKISGGEDSPVLVMLHGMFGGLSNFDPLLEQMADITAYVPDIPLFTMDRSELTVPLLAEWLDGFLATCSIEQPILLGNSMGGHVALEYARSYPGNVRALVLTGSSGLLENDFGNSCPKRYDRDYIKKQAGRTFYEDMIDESTVDEICEVVQSPSKLAKVLAIARNTHNYNMEEFLDAIRQPVLLVWGRDDIITPPEVAAAFYEKLPDARLKWIHKCGHAPMMERPGEFMRHLTGFLSELESKPKIISKNHEENYSYF